MPRPPTTIRATSSSTHPSASEGFLMEDGARRPSSYYDIPCLNSHVLRITASQTLVGQGPPRHVLQQPSVPRPPATIRATSSSNHPRASEIGYLMEDGARRPSSYYDIPCLNSHVLRITASQTLVGRWPPRHVLQQPSAPRPPTTLRAPSSSTHPCHVLQHPSISK